MTKSRILSVFAVAGLLLAAGQIRAAEKPAERAAKRPQAEQRLAKAEERLASAQPQGPAAEIHLRMARTHLDVARAFLKRNNAAVALSMTQIAERSLALAEGKEVQQ
jgi:hypothetical protein